MKLNNFTDNKEALKDIRDDINEALKAVNEKYGITLNLKNIRYGEFEFSTKIEGKIASPEAINEDVRKTRASWEIATMRDKEIDVNWFGKEFQASGKTLKVVGYNRRSRKSPINLVDSNGKTYKASVGFVKAHI